METKKTTAPKKTSQRKGNKKVILIALLIVIILVVGIVMIVKKNSNKAKEIPNISEVVTNITQSSQEKINVKEVSIQSSGANMVVKGKVENTAETVKSMKVTFYVYNEQHQIKGEAFTQIEKLDKKATTDFTISIMGDYSDLKQYEVKVEEVTR